MSALCREVVTLQLGHYSNFVGTHWWNLQDASLSYDPDTPPGEIQSDAVFREGQTLGGSVTYTPRLIAMDLKGSLRSLRLEGSLYDSGKDTSAVTWEGSLMMHKQSPPSKNSFLEDLDKLENGDILAQPQFPSSSQQPNSSASFSVDTVNSQLARRQKNYRLEGSVKVWSDFLRIHLHPRTVSVLQYNHDGEFNRLEAFGQGEALLQGALLEELEDKLHFFIEECDYLQGFQVLCDIADGFAGLGSKVTEMLRDTYGGRGILTWGMAPVSHPDLTTMKNIFHVLNCTLGTLHMANNSSLFCPLTLRGGLCLRPEGAVAFPYVNYDPSLWYHSSSILALGLDALTLPYRMRNNSVPMWQLADSLTGAGRKVAAAFGAIPFPMMHGGCLPDALHGAADMLPWQPMSACPESENGRCYGQWAVLKGFEGQRLISSLSAGTPPPSPLHSLHSGEDVLVSYIRSFYPNTPLALQLAASPSKLTPPFPRIFSSSLSDQGFIMAPSSGGASAQTSWVSSVPVLTSLQSGPNVGTWLSEMRRDVTAFDVRRVAPSFLTQGLEMADYQEALEQLRLLARCYRDDSGGVMQSSSEEDDDDDDDD